MYWQGLQEKMKKERDGSLTRAVVKVDAHGVVKGSDGRHVVRLSFPELVASPVDEDQHGKGGIGMLVFIYGTCVIESQISGYVYHSHDKHMLMLFTGVIIYGMLVCIYGMLVVCIYGTCVGATSQAHAKLIKMSAHP